MERALYFRLLSSDICFVRLVFGRDLNSGQINTEIFGQDLDFPGGPVAKNLPASAGTQVWSLV